MEALLQVNKENIEPKKSIFNSSSLQEQLKKFNNKTQKNLMLSSNSSRSDNNQSNIKDQKVDKTLVDVKIQQLHDKMKLFFNMERKSHLSEIGPQIEQLQKHISELRAELNRPKSNQQVEAQRIELMNRKTCLLTQLQKLSKNIKQNKKVMTDSNIQKDELERQIKSANATILKYKIKIEKQKLLEGSCNNFLNQSGNLSQDKLDQTASQINLDNIHITEVQVTQVKKSKTGLPLLKKSGSKAQSTWIDDKQNRLNHSNISNYSANNPLSKCDGLKSSRFQLSTQLKHYAKKVNTEKWKQVDYLFQSLKCSKFQKLSEVLIDELRKKESAKYHQKGYGQGFNGCKTHQMKLQIRKIFKNYKTEQFFNQVMIKRAVKKQLTEIFQNIKDFSTKK